MLFELVFHVLLESVVLRNRAVYVYVIRCIAYNAEKYKIVVVVPSIASHDSRTYYNCTRLYWYDLIVNGVYSYNCTGIVLDTYCTGV